VSEQGEAWFDGRPEQLSMVGRKLENQLSIDRFLDGACTRLYYGLPLMSDGPRQATADAPQASWYLEAIDGLTTENLIKPVIDACAAQVVRKPAIRVVTSGSSWKKSRSARKLSRLLTGLATSSGYLAARANIFKDSARCLLGGSKWLVDPKTGKVTCERVLPHTIVFSQAQGPRPRDLFQHHGINRRVLARRYPEHARAIMHLPAYKPDIAFMIDQPVVNSDPDQVDVWEGWHLKEGDDPGRYVMTAGDVVLEDQEWVPPVFPIPLLAFGQSYSSAAGDPLARQLLPFQLKLNRFNRRIEDNADANSHPQKGIPIGGGVTAEMLANAPDGQFYYDPGAAGAARVYWLPGQMLPPQHYTERDQIRDGAYAAAGVSRSAAAGMKPAGVDSGVGIREARDEASGRQLPIADALEDWDELNARTALALMRVAYKGKKGMRIKAPNTRMLEEIDWDQVGDLAEDEIEVRAFITSAIPNTPAGREETLEEWVQNDVISRKRATRWQSNPDLATLEDEDSAVEDYCRKVIETALDDGREMAPEPVLGSEGLGIMLELAGKALLEALTQPEPPPPRNLDLLRRLIEATKELIPAPAPPVPAPMPGPAAAPPAQPTAAAA
jgi:hypothetical protein